MSVKHAFPSPQLSAASRRAPSAALPASGALDSRLSHKVTLGEGIRAAAGLPNPAVSAHNCVARTHVVRRRRRQPWQIQAVDRDSESKNDFNEDNARRALSELDQQLDTLLKKEAPQPKIRASNLSESWRDEMKEEEDVFTGTSLLYGALALFLLTVLYNIFFITVIKPAIDFPDEAETEAPAVAPQREAPSSETLQMQSLRTLFSYSSAPNLVAGEL